MTQQLTASLRQCRVPLAVLHERRLSVFESIVEHLKDVQGLTYHQIAELTARNDRTIWTVYDRARKKRQQETTGKERERKGGATDTGQRVQPAGSLTIPLAIFADRGAAVLERIALHLKDSLGLNYHQIAELTCRDERTIWTAYQRAKRKRTESIGQKEKERSKEQ